jgi:hypothetical protein
MYMNRIIIGLALAWFGGFIIGFTLAHSLYGG